MRYAILGDIHGNYEALEAVIKYIENEYDNEITGFIFTGDYVGDFADGSKVVDLMQKISKEYKTYIIKGNRETDQVDKYLEYKKHGKEPNWDLDTTMGAALISCRELGSDRLKYLNNLPNTCIINPHGKRPIFIKHKMPLDAKELERVKKDNMVVIAGHTHEVHQGTKDGIALFNPGSVGLPDDGIVAATFGIMESTIDGNWKFDVHDVKYDYEKTLESLKNNKDLYQRCCGWGKALELSLNTGVNCTSLYSTESKRLSMLMKEYRNNHIQPNYDMLYNPSFLLSQNRYGNVNYDGSRLTDMSLENIGGVEVFGPSEVISVGSKQKKAPRPSKEMYDVTFNNVQRIASSVDRDMVFRERHGRVVK